MFSGGGAQAVDLAGPRRSQKKACIKIVEQPASKALRFRYECEGRSAGSIPGVNSTLDHRTYPTIRIEGYKGRAVVVVSCVTKDPPYRPHPHNLVGKEACRRGVCTVEVASEDMTVTFGNLGIQCVKKKDIKEALKIREEIRVDPYRTGFSHKAQPNSIDLNVVRLCFQVFLENVENGKFTIPLAPVVSEPIYDKKAMVDLVICKLSHCCCSVAGGKDIILLSEKVAKDDVQVRFFEERGSELVWESFGEFQPAHVHKQVAISFRAPRYRDLQVEQPVKVLIQLRRPSDGATSDAVPFQFLPLELNPELKRRRKNGDDPKAQVLSRSQVETDELGAMQNRTLEYGLNLVKAEHADRPPQRLSTLEQHQQFYTPLNLQYSQQPQCSFQQHTTLKKVSGEDAGSVLLPLNTPSIRNQIPSNIQGVGGVGSLDICQYSSEQRSLKQLDSGDLEPLAMLDDNLSRTFSSNLSLTDIRVSQAEAGRAIRTEAASVGGQNGQNGMTDGITRMTNTIEELCTLNDVYNLTRNHPG